MRYFVTLEGVEHVVDVTELPGGRHAVRLLPSADADSASVEPISAELSSTGGGLTVRLGERIYDLVLEGERPEVQAWASGRRASLTVESARMRAAAGVRTRGAEGHDGTLLSPMPGKIVKLLVREGDEVSAGTPLIVVEAMKMENELTSPKSGVVQKLHVRPGEAVEGGAPLVTVA